MTRLKAMPFADGRIRVGPWRDDARTAFVAPLVGGPIPSVDAVETCLGHLRGQGYGHVITTALNDAEQVPFIDSGFAPGERLHLLTHHLDQIPKTPAITHRPSDAPTRIRRARRTDRRQVLTIDARAFDDFWRLDAPGLQEALTATPTSRFRVASSPGVVAYSVVGRSIDRGYLQRVAVDPDHQGRGIGTALVTDALVWLQRRGARSAVVNTQASNEQALKIYEHLGFEREPTGLVVLERALP